MKESKETVSQTKNLIMVFSTIAVFLMFTGINLYFIERDEIKSTVSKDLEAASKLKVEQIKLWRNERFGEADFLYKNITFKAHTDQLLQDPKSQKLVDELSSWLHPMMENHDYYGIFIYDRRGNSLIDLKSGEEKIPEEFNDTTFHSALRKNQITFSDLTKDKNGLIYLDIAVPMQTINNKCVIMFRVNPNLVFFPLVQTFQRERRTSESLLVRKQGNNVLFLNELRHKKNTALQFSISLKKKELPAAAAIFGYEGIVEGIDYRGVPVLSMLQKVSGTNWSLITKIDLDEIYEPLHVRTVLIVIFSVLLLILSGSVLYSINVSQQKDFFKKKVELEIEREDLAQRLDYISRFANDIIWLQDEKGYFVDVNEKAISTYGYSREEFLRTSAADLRTEKFRVKTEIDLNETIEKGGGIFETEHVKKDGTVLPVEISSRSIILKGKKYYQSIVRDISERKNFERNIINLNRVYALLSNTNEAIVKLRDKQELFDKICSIAVENGKFISSVIFLVNDKGRTLEVKSGFGPLVNDLDRHEIKIDADTSFISPSAKAASAGKPNICNDIEKDKLYEKWYMLLKNHDVNSCGSFPFKIKNKTAGVFSVYSNQKNFFSNQETNLFEELTNDISFALEFLDNEEERQQIVASLAESEMKYRLMFESNPYPMWVYDIETLAFLEVNDSAVSQYGYSKEEFLSMTLKDIRPVEDIELLMNNISQNNGGREVSGHWRHKKSSGEIIFVDIISHSIYYQKKKARLVLSVDVTEKVDAEKSKELLTFERDKLLKRLQLQFDTMPIGLIAVGKDSKIVEWNPAAEKIYGYTKDEAAGKKMMGFIIDRSEKKFFESFTRQIANSDKTESSIQNNIAKDGRRILIEGYFTALRDDNGEYLGYMAMMRDITEIKKAEEELLKSREDFRALAGYLQKSREEERLMIAREIHDEVGQVLTSLKMNLSLLNREVEATKENINARSVGDELKSMSGIIDRSVVKIRKLIMQLRPEILDKLGLVPAIEWQINEFEETSGLRCTFKENFEDEEEIDKEISLVIFRVFQEALTNILRHAKATTVDVELLNSLKAISLIVVDNGIGIKPKSTEEPKSFGLLGMQERAFLVGGYVNIQSEEGKGTKIILEIPKGNGS
ncbi:MAG: PAS domain S-box protein [Ignavibacteriales bacterium]|nr:PAS domain S-box protein [Ignavibacteriales bacterium]